MKKFALLIFIAVLTGCNATMPQQTTKTSDDDPSRKCFNSLNDDGQLLILHKKVGKPSDLTSATLEMLADQDRVTSDDEKKAIQYWATMRNACVDAGKRFREIHQPSMYSGLIESQNERFVILLSKLYSGEISYGGFNTNRRQLAAEFYEYNRNARIQEQQSTYNLQQAQAAQRAKESADFTNALILMQMSRPQVQPIPFPNRMNCNSRRVGNSVQTDCW